MPERSQEVLVIGAGLGGLSAAIALKVAGLGVTVLEASPRPGGKADVVELEGVEVDTGPSVLTLPGVLDALFRQAGTSLAEELELCTLSPAFRYHFPGGLSIDFHQEPEDTSRSVTQALGAQAGAEFRSFLDYARGIWALSSPAFVFGPAPGADMLSRLGPRRLARFWEVDPLRAMWPAICQRVRSPELRAILARFATYNGSDPRQAPATLNCIAWVELGMGAYGVRGGVYSLVRALERVGRKLGVRYRYSAPVQGLRLSGRRARGVTLADGSSLDADAVVCNADVAHLNSDLLPAEHRNTAESTPSLSGWNAVLRAARSDPPRPGHAVLFPPDYLREFADLFDSERPPQVPSVYLCAQERCHGRAGWPDAEPLFLMANAPPLRTDGAGEPQRYADLKATVTQRLLEARLIQPQDRVLWERDPAGLAQRFPRSRGALYGASSNSMFAAFRRPANRHPALQGLYLASGSAHPGGGMPLCVQSGRMAAHLLLRDLGISNPEPSEGP